MDLNRLPSLGSSSKYVEGNSSQTSCNPDYFDIAPARVVYSSSTSEPLNFEPLNLAIGTRNLKLKNCC
jgi:hypothetical protein